MMSPDALNDDESHFPAPVSPTATATPVDTTTIAMASAAAAAAAAAESKEHGNSHRVANAVVHVEPLGSSGLGERSPGEGGERDACGGGMVCLCVCVYVYLYVCMCMCGHIAYAYM